METTCQTPGPALDPWAPRLQAARAGSAESLELLFRDLCPWWLALAWRLLRDHQEAQEAVQDASLCLLHNLDRFDPARCSRASSWLARLLVNCAIDRRRRRRRRLALPLVEGDLPGRPDDGPGELAERREQADLLRRWLGELPPLDREALLLRFEQGLTYERIAGRLGLSLSAAYQVVNKALKKLARKAGRAGSPRRAG